MCIKNDDFSNEGKGACRSQHRGDHLVEEGTTTAVESKLGEGDRPFSGQLSRDNMYRASRPEDQSANRGNIEETEAGTIARADGRGPTEAALSPAVKRSAQLFIAAALLEPPPRHKKKKTLKPD